MTVPAQAAGRFALGLAFGVLLGLGYDFLRPLRRRHNAPADALFVLYALYLWIYYSFDICQGDIRAGTTAAMGLGALVWVFTLGKGLSGIFYLFWNGIFRVFHCISLVIKKFFYFFRIFFKKGIGIWEKKGYNKMD